MKKICIVFTAAAVVASIAATTQAQTIYQDNFGVVTSSIAGQSPDTADAGGGTWAIGPNWWPSQGGAYQVLSAGTVSVPVVQNDHFTDAYLPINTVSANTLTGLNDFTLTINAIPDTVGTRVDLDLFNGTGGNIDNNELSFFQVANTYMGLNGNYPGISPALSTSSPSLIQISYTAANTTLAFSVAGTVYGTLPVTVGDITGLTGVGFGFSNYSGNDPQATVESFQLTQQVPEPSSYAMILGGFGILIAGWRIRRRL